jgi:hypothetical protein
LIRHGEPTGLTPELPTATGSLIRPSGRALRPHPDPTNHAGFPQGFTSRSTELSKSAHILRAIDAPSPRGGYIGRSGPSPRPIRSRPDTLMTSRSVVLFDRPDRPGEAPLRCEAPNDAIFPTGPFGRTAGAIRPGQWIASDSTRRRVTLFGRFAGFRQESRPAGPTANPLITPDLPIWFVGAPNFLRGHRAGPIRATDADGMTTDDGAEGFDDFRFSRRRPRRDPCYSNRATPSPGFGKRTKTSGSCPGMMSLGLEAIRRIRSCAARFACASNVWAIGACLSRFS